MDRDIPHISAYIPAGNGKPKPLESTHLFVLMLRATQVFGDVHAAAKWFATPKYSLGGLRQFDLTETEAGRNSIVRLLDEMEEAICLQPA